MLTKCFLEKTQTNIRSVSLTCFPWLNLYVCDLTLLCLVLTAFGYYIVSGLGITAGAHRLWSHRTYKARLPLKVFLIISNTMAFQVRNQCCSALRSQTVDVSRWKRGDQHLVRISSRMATAWSSLLLSPQVQAQGWGPPTMGIFRVWRIANRRWMGQTILVQGNFPFQSPCAITQCNC